jgi:hypothetical protein
VQQKKQLDTRNKMMAAIENVAPTDTRHVVPSPSFTLSLRKTKTSQQPNQP